MFTLLHFLTPLIPKTDINQWPYCSSYLLLRKHLCFIHVAVLVICSLPRCILWTFMSCIEDVFVSLAQRKGKQINYSKLTSASAKNYPRKKPFSLFQVGMLLWVTPTWNKLKSFHSFIMVKPKIDMYPQCGPVTVWQVETIVMLCSMHWQRLNYYI